ncbi:uncharacterized protein A4U43_C01F18590 [Asparagus officinalis]|uniref:Uncharacterized protein n=1 Tax=Asparagus officinalis TaxID=4686 RepID=A0A5P1FU20_ASPOF|nr:uncharacterized protein A4U43_C01F18590 [Asparagus officinalis]
MMSAALVEKKRLNHPDPKSMSFLWLAPQIFLIGTAEAFAYVGINRLTGGAKEGWLRNDLNKSRLDYFYWILCAINAVNLVFYLWAAYVYKGRNDGASGKDLEEDAIWDEEVVFRIIRHVELTENISQEDSR